MNASDPARKDLCSDEELGYERSRSRFVEGAGLTLDESYRLAHLPLIVPQHPAVIPRRDGAYYEMGRHPRMFSLVLPVPSEALMHSQAYRQLDREMREAAFAPKIAWDLIDRRRAKLHATICGSLSVGEAPALDPGALDALKEIGPVTVELRGLFSGNVNVGRLYLRVYPERRGGTNSFRRIQRVLGRRETDLYVVGLYNLLDDLTPAEASALTALIERWWDRPLLRYEADHLWLLGAEDDLVLTGDVAATIPLVR